MYMSKLRLNGPKAKQVLAGGAYRHHQTLWALFSDSPERCRDFVYRQKDDEPGLSFLVVSKRLPSDKFNIWEMETKTYDPVLSAGEQLKFSLRTNPIRTGRNADGKQARFDVVMDKKKALREQGISREEMPSQAAIAQEAGACWLIGRQKKIGVEIDSGQLRVDGYRILEMPRAKGGGRIRIATLDFDGFCRVVNPEKLKNALFNGLGPAKAFGCGLLLIKRV